MSEVPLWVEAAVAVLLVSSGLFVVVSAVGTRDYYRARGFADGELYQHRALR